MKSNVNVKQQITAFILIAAASWIVYGNSLGNEFVFDDLDQVVNKYSIQSFKNIPDILGLTGDKPDYRPIRTISYCIDYFFSGLNPAGYHVFNIFYHIVASMILYLIAGHLLKNHKIALITAILFAVHPVHTDAVTYISGRRDVLSTLFYLAGFYWFLLFRSSPRKKYLLLTVAAYLLGLFTKEMAVTLPVLLVAYDVCYEPGEQTNISRGISIRRIISISRIINIIKKYKYQYLLLFLAGGLYTWFVLQNYSMTVLTAEKRVLQSAYKGTRYSNLLTAARIVCFYIKILFFPLTLNADYSYNAFPLSQSFFEIKTIFSFVLLAAIILLTVRFRRKTPAVFAALWFFITILPVSRIIPHHEMVAEHYLYLPSAGFCLLLAWLAAQTWRFPKARIAGYLVLAIIIILFSARTVVRNRDWKDPLTLWGKTVEIAPDCARAHNNYGAFLHKKGLNEKAVIHLNRALEIAPTYFLPHHNLALLYYNTEGWSEKVEQEIERCLEQNQNYPLAHFNRGWFYHQEGWLEKARCEYEQTLMLRPHHVRAMVNLAAIHYQAGGLDEALELCQRAAAVNPNNYEVQHNLGKLYLKTGRTEEAENAMNRARELQKKAPR